MKTKNKNFTVAQKLYQVETKLIETDSNWEVNGRVENVIARTADEALKKVHLRSNSEGKEFYAGVKILAEIDKF